MKIESNARAEMPRQTTKAGTGTGRVKEENQKQDAKAVAREAEMRKERDPVANQVKKVQTVDVTG